MKKFFFSMMAMLAFAVYSMHAQERHVWTFDLTGADVANLDADANWTKNGSDTDGNTTQWYNANLDVFGSTELLANGYGLFPGLKITMGNATQKNNSVIVYRNGRIRLTRNDMRIIIPHVDNKQTITITGKSANATATNRGIQPVSSNTLLLVLAAHVARCNRTG